VPTQYDAGKAALDELIEWAESHVREGGRNEATTRLHLIDRLLRDVLQWPADQIAAEDRVPDGYVDYVLGHPAARFVIEAKREGAYFDLPAGTVAGVHSIGSLTDGTPGRNLRLALEQASSYAAKKGCSFAGVTNGHQFVLFLGVRTDGTPPLGGRALVYPSLADQRADFRRLWDQASPAGVESRNLYKTLQLTVAPPPEPLSARLPRYPGTKRRTDLQAGLEILGDLFLEDVTRLEELREDFLRDCYATSGALTQYASVSRQILQARYALLHDELGTSGVAAVQDKKGLSHSLTQDMLAAAASQRPIVLLGDVGVGKTTFIQRLVSVDAKDVFAESYSIYIDFGRQAAYGSRLEEYVWNETVEQLQARYGVDIDEASFAEAVHHRALNRFDRGVKGKLRTIDLDAYERERISFLSELVADRGKHIMAALSHLKGSHRRQVVIFLDNIDQRSSDDQEAVFLIAVSLAASWPATVFVTLRPGTFYRSRREGTLTAYQPRVFTISPPRSDVMLQRRVEFALKQLHDTGRLGSFPAGVTVDSASLAHFLEILQQNFQENEDLLTLIENMAGGNMRLALRFVTDFVGSGHIDTSKMLESYHLTGRYHIAVHDFLRAILLGENRYYDPDDSPIANLFSIASPDGREHFLVPLLLEETQSLGERGPGEGFVPVDALYDFAQGLGFDADQVARCLGACVADRLLERAPRYGGEQRSLHYRITTVGSYSVRFLATFFAYVDAVVVDTPILDEGYSRVIGDARTLGERVERADYFRLYLDKQWKLVGQIGRSMFDWHETSKQLARDIRAVGRKADPDTWSQL
jgi:hypothetical protein